MSQLRNFFCAAAFAAGLILAAKPVLTQNATVLFGSYNGVPKAVAVDVSGNLSTVLSGSVNASTSLKIRCSSATGVVSICENAAGLPSLLDVITDNDSTADFFRMWNKTWSATFAGLYAYQENGGYIHLYNSGSGAFDMGGNFAAIAILDQTAVTPGQPGSSGLPGIVVGGSHGELFGFADAQSNPSAPSVANIGAAGAATVTYKIVGVMGANVTYSQFPEQYSAASSAGTTNTANATLNGTNFNRVTFTWPAGYNAVDVYRTAGGPSQGKIARVHVATLDDTGLAGDAATPSTTNATGRVTWAGQAISLIINNTARVLWSTTEAGLKSDMAVSWFSGLVGSTLDSGIKRGGTAIVKVTDGSSGYGTVDVLGIKYSGNLLSGTTGSISGALVGIACDTGTASITGATTAMVAVASPNTYPGDGIFWKAQVTSAGTVTVYVCTDVTVTPTASTYNVRVIP